MLLQTKNRQFQTVFTLQENTFLHRAKINQSILKHDRRCFTCIGKGHNSEQCEKSCRKCGDQKHHQSICPELHNNPSPRKLQEKSTPTASGDQCEKDGTTTAMTNAESANPKCSVLLQTASAVATNEERNQLPSGYYSTMEVKGRTLPRVYVRNYSLNLFKIRS